MKEGDELPLRRVWYAFIKATLERGLEGYVYGKGSVIGDNRKPEDGDYTNAFSDIIKNTNLWYSDFGIRNPSATSTIVEPKYFPPILIGLEKRSYYDVLQQMSELLGFSIYSAGGQSKFAEQEVLAKNIKETIFDPFPEYDDLDIYIISDFDPAGIDIAINIGEHQKFYQERFGKTVTMVRLAPLPEHYTEEELKQSLYNVESSERETWNYPENIHLRDRIREVKGGIDDNYPNEYKKTKSKFNKLAKIKTKTPDQIEEMKDLRKVLDDFEAVGEGRAFGLEVESLPDQPLNFVEDEYGNVVREILKNPPTDWDDHDYNDINGSWKGLTRMRFILFDKLIEQYGLDQTFEVLLEAAAPEAYSLTDDYIDEENFEESKNQLSKTGDLVREFTNKPSAWIKNYITTEKGDLEDKIQSWIDDIIAQFIDESHKDFRKDEKEKLIEEIQNGLYYAISRNRSSYSIEFPVDFKITDLDGKEEDFMIIIPKELIANLKPIIDYSLCIAANIQEGLNYIEELEKPHLTTVKDEYGTEHKTADGKEMLSKKFKLPLIRQCESVKVSLSKWYPYKMTIDEVIWKEGTEGSKIEADCSEYTRQIRNLHDDIAHLEWEYEKDIMALEKQLENIPEQIEQESESTEIAEERLKRIAEMRVKENELIQTISDWEDKYVKLNTELRGLNDVIDNQNTRLNELKGVEEKIVRFNKLLEECNIEKEKLNKQIEEGIMPEEAAKIMAELEKLKTETAAEIAELRKQIAAKPVAKPTKAVKADVQKEVKKEVEKFKKTVADKWIEAKELEEEKITAKMKSMIALLNEQITGTEYYGQWGEKPMSWEEMSTTIPMELFTESKLIRDLGEGNLALGRKIWDNFSEKEKSTMINKNLVGFTTLQEQIKTEKEELAELKEHLHDVLGGDLPLIYEDETYEDMLYRVPFKYWYESPDTDDPKVFKQRINSYKAQTKDAPYIIRDLIIEKLGEMEKLYNKSIPKIQKLTGQPKFDQLSLLSGDLNKYNSDIKKLFYYGR
jgi:hypothetical protein